MIVSNLIILSNMCISMLDGEEKTKIINGMSKSIEDLVGSKEYGGWLVVLIHNVTVIVVLIQIFCRNSKIEVGLGTTVWLFMVFCHFVFNGCILVIHPKEFDHFILVCKGAILIPDISKLDGQRPGLSLLVRSFSWLL